MACEEGSELTEHPWLRRRLVRRELEVGDDARGRSDLLALSGGESLGQLRFDAAELLPHFGLLLEPHERCQCVEPLRLRKIDEALEVFEADVARVRRPLAEPRKGGSITWCTAA